MAQRVCPVWVGYLLASPVRKLFQIYETIKPTGTFFVVEPKGHVSEKDFEITISIAEQNGFNVIDSPKIGRSRTVLLGKKGISKHGIR